MPPIQAIIPVTPGSGLDLDAVSMTIGPNTVVRETMVIADPTNPTSLAGVTVGGALMVDASATTQPIFGTLTPNNAAPDGHNIGVLPALANASHPTYTEGDQVLLSTDLAGNLRVSVTGSVVANNNITEWNSVALGSPSAYGTGPGAVNVIGVNAFVTNSVAVTGTFFQATQPVSIAGDVEVVQDTAADFNATVVGTGTFAVQAACTQTTSPWIVAGGGTAGTAATGVVTVQGIASMTPLLVTATFATPQHVITDTGSTTAVTQATASNLNAAVVGTKTNNNAAPGGNNVGTLPAVANAAAQSWTEGDQVALSVDLSGHQRVVATGAAATGAAVSGNPVLIAGKDGSGNAQPFALLVNGQIGNAVSQPGSDGVSNAIWGVPIGAAGANVNAGSLVGLNVFNGTTWDRQRTPNKFFTAQVNASTTGNSAVWTPTSGKKFRLMKFQVTAQGLAATATGVVTVTFQDATTQINTGAYDVDVPAVANVVSGTDNISGGWIDLGNGFLSAAANNVLNFNISAAGAGTVGSYRLNVCGTEE